jgi:hypothetical protein
MGDIVVEPSSPSDSSRIPQKSSKSKMNPIAAIKYARQAKKLSHLRQDPDSNGDSAAVKAEWITPHDPVITTAGGGRLPGVPLAEAHKLNMLRNGIDQDEEDAVKQLNPNDMAAEMNGTLANGSASHGDNEKSSRRCNGSIQRSGEGSLQRAMPPSRTNPLFPPLPLYGPPSLSRDIQCMIFQVVSSVLSLAFLGVIILGSIFTSIPLMFRHLWLRLRFQDPDAKRPFILEELRREKLRQEAERDWKKKLSQRTTSQKMEASEDETGDNAGFIPTEGGPDPIVCDVAYYARRVGLDMEEFKVQTEDGFIIRLWHIYDPKEFSPMSSAEREARGPHIFTGHGPSRPSQQSRDSKPKFPILMMHGLLQSSGAYCTNDDASLAFYLCKQGYDVWLGNNRCGFHPEHTLLSYNDPRMWAWNIRQMGVMVSAQ